MTATHVYPTNDWIEHRTEDHINDPCPCEPSIIYIDEDTGQLLPMPVVIHNAIDGSE